MAPSKFQSGNDTERVSWERKVAVEFDESTAIACIKGIRSEERAREVLGLVNEHGVSDRRKPMVVKRIRELRE